MKVEGVQVREIPGAGLKASSKSLSVGSGIYRRTKLPSLLGTPFCKKRTKGFDFFVFKQQQSHS